MLLENNHSNMVKLTKLQHILKNKYDVNITWVIDMT